MTRRCFLVPPRLTLRNSSSRFLPLPSDHSQYTGDLTYYGPGLGACGVTSSETDNIVSISHFVFDAEQKGTDPNTNPLCGLKIRATRFDEQVNGMRSVDLTVVDRCKWCPSPFPPEECRLCGSRQSVRKIFSSYWVNGM